MTHDTMPKTGERQTLMFSATFRSDVQVLAKRFLSPEYLFVAVGIVGAACDDVTQVFYEVGFKGKRAKLLEIIREDESNKELEGIIVFVETKKNADFIAALLSQNHFPTTSIHGDRFQREREEALDDFKVSKIQSLIQ